MSMESFENRRKPVSKVCVAHSLVSNVAFLICITANLSQVNVRFCVFFTKPICDYFEEAVDASKLSQQRTPSKSFKSQTREGTLLIYNENALKAVSKCDRRDKRNWKRFYGKSRWHLTSNGFTCETMFFVEFSGSTPIFNGLPLKRVLEHEPKVTMYLWVSLWILLIHVTRCFF